MIFQQYSSFPHLTVTQNVLFGLEINKTQIALDHAGKLIVAKVNTDENPEWAEKYEVQGIPTMLLVAKGKVVHKQVGALPEPYLMSMVEEFLGAVEEASASAA